MYRNNIGVRARGKGELQPRSYGNFSDKTLMIRATALETCCWRDFQNFFYESL